MKDYGVFELFERPVPFCAAVALIDEVSRYDCGFLREEAVRRYGFSIPCSEAVSAVAALSPLLEVGAGSGYLAVLLRAAGADVVATDIGDQRTYSKLWSGSGVERLSALESVEKWPDRNVFVSWPTYANPWAKEMAERIASGRTLAVIGEDRGGCTADAGFFCLLESGFSEVARMRIPQWPGIHDVLVISVRK